MAYHSLKFISWAFSFPHSIECELNDMKREDIRIPSHYIDTLNYMKKKKNLLVYDLNINILNENAIIPLNEPYCG